jgi:HlyD family secretion protein
MRRSPSIRGASAVKIILGLATLAGAGVLGWMYVPGWYEKYKSGNDASNATRLTAETVKVVRQDLRVMLTSSGRLRAIQSVPILPGITNRQLRITWIAEEGKPVKPGDLLVKFDTADIEEQQRQLKQQLEEATQQRTNAEAAIAIQKSDAESAIATAEAALKSSTTELNTYRDLEAPKRVNDLDSSINDNRKKVAEARQAVTEARQRLEDQLFSEEDQRKQLERSLVEAQQTAATAERILASNQLQKKIFRQYEYPQQMENKQQARRSAELGVEKAKVNAARAMDQRKAELARYDNTMKQQQRRLEQIADEIKKSNVTAPVEGLIVYGDPSRGYAYGGERITVGSNWYGGNVLMTIPDLSAFEIDINVPEDYRGRVTEGVPAAITFEAVPGLVFSGKLKEIARIGTTSGYAFDETSAPRSFKSIVSLNGIDPRLVSGMLAKIEITADVVPQALLVPVDALYNENGTPIAYVRLDKPGSATRYEKRRVRTGKRNDSYVQIVEGLFEGETLSLVEPPDAVSLKPTNELAPTTIPTTAPTTAPSDTPTTAPTTIPTTAPAEATP